MNNRMYVSCGDLNGIGLEVFSKAVQSYLESSQFIIFLPLQLQYLLPNSILLEPHTLPLPHQNGLFISPISGYDNYIPEYGKFSQICGNISHTSFIASINKLKSDFSAGFLTLPIHKKSFTSAGSPFAGHTEYIGHLLGEKNPLMVLMNEEMKVALLTVHIPIQNISGKITKSLIYEKAIQYDKSLKNDFGISNPKIALLGLNPHAGDEGVIGNEEIEIYKPAIESLQSGGVNIYGPFASDGFFGAKLYKQFDGILASYHDQGLIPVKLSGMDHGVNFSAGSSIVRTSPDHGTAYDIAGKNIASPESTKNAIEWNIKIRQKRMTA